MTDTAPDVHGETLLHPEYAALLTTLPSLAIDESTLPGIRSQLGVGSFEWSGAVEHADHTIAGPDGNHVVLRTYRPVGAEGALPCVYAVHGGGYVLGDLGMLDERFERWCPELGCAGVSVEYRLAPEHPYPAPLEDCYAGLTWVHANAEALGLDRARIGIQGTSAGGGLAAGLALLARDRGEVPVAFQVLECPMIDDRQDTLSSRLDRLAVWSRESNTFGWRAYLGELSGADELPPYAAAGRVDDLSGLPPAFVAVGGADGFRDEDVQYALRLLQAGIPTELHVYPGVPHGAQLVPTAAAVLQWERDVLDWIARQIT